MLISFAICFINYKNQAYFGLSSIRNKKLLTEIGKITISFDYNNELNN